MTNERLVRNAALPDEERVWIVLGSEVEYHVLPVEVRDGVNHLAPGHTVSGWCGCGPGIEQHPLGGARLVSHVEPSWPNAEAYSGRSQ